MRPGQEELTTLSAVLARRLAAEPQSLAFVEGERQYTVAAFDALVGQAAAWLQARGIGPGDRVGLWLVNRIEWLALYFALARRGAAAVAVNTRYRGPEVQHILGLSRATMLITQRAFRGIDFPGILASLDASHLPALRQIGLLDAVADAAADVAVSLSADTSGDARSEAPASLLGRPVHGLDLLAAGKAAEVPVDLANPLAESTFFATSGTTKGPKLVAHSQRSAALHAQRCASRYGFDEPGARLCALMPFCGTYGLAAVLGAFAGGAPSVIVDSFEPAATARLLNEAAITHAFCTDDMLNRLGAEVPGHNPFPAARVLGFAAFSPGAAEMATELWARGMPLFGLYGSSEVWALCAIQHRNLPLAERIVGGGLPASPDAQVRVRDIESGQLLGPGEVGELELKAETNFIGYLDNPGATAEAVLPDGFFRTGDLGLVRPDGTFAYLNRRDDSIRLSGFLVNPVEIEDPIKSLPGVADVQVVAVPIGERQRAVAFVIAEPGASLEASALIDGAARLMAPYRTPARVWFVDDFPSTQGANGTKIQRGRLREMALARLAAEG